MGAVNGELHTLLVARQDIVCGSQRGSFEKFYDLPSETVESKSAAQASSSSKPPAAKKLSWSAVGGVLNTDAVSTAAPSPLLSPRGCSPSTSPPNSPRRSEKDVVLFYTVEAMSTR